MQLFYRFALMEQLLDNPAWNALISGNKNLSFGSRQVKYFDREVSPFAAFSENNADYFGLLHELLPHNGPVLYISPVEMQIPGSWRVLQVIRGLQMLFNIAVDPDEPRGELIALTREHVPQMLALAKLTNPGPSGRARLTSGIISVFLRTINW